MPSLVILHVSLGPEALTAPLGANERPFVSVDEHVDAQVLLFRECLSAGRFWTFKWLGPIVNVEVRVQTNFTGENFFAPLVGAPQNDLLSVVILNLALRFA